jgi:hypothetical protein
VEPKSIQTEGKKENIAMDLQMEFVDKEYKGFFNEQIKKK